MSISSLRPSDGNWTPSLMADACSYQEPPPMEQPAKFSSDAFLIFIDKMQSQSCGFIKVLWLNISFLFCSLLCRTLSFPARIFNRPTRLPLSSLLKFGIVLIKIEKKKKSKYISSYKKKCAGKLL